ncbi:hypothetical protein OU787_17290 [Kitasatospora sp. YST-16]|uniref:hypothetical protein n=1 Tax=Kitasatospora sp. YST-16 TaxID=2998080 RepID=UPI002284F126|nr:hypothetical protein [Kitasatospora sp. YST-16]WAL73105.1 hypothetical protein OU787_17290 [Kitasatospora sp. YST-16]WNW39158.1 hypothetical protein RKE32_17250 [Streptomyces sp. Li-HN-5-13]
MPENDPTTTPTPTPEPKPEEKPAPTPETKPEEKPDETADALQAEKDARAAAEKEAADLKAENARLRRSNAATKGTDLDEIRSEVRAEFVGQLVRAEVRAAASGRLADPADALALLDLEKLTPEKGEPDPAAIKAALDELLTAKPYLAPAGEGSKVWGDVGAGQRKSARPEPATPLERLRNAFGNS